MVPAHPPPELPKPQTGGVLDTPLAFTPTSHRFYHPQLGLCIGLLSVPAAGACRLGTPSGLWIHSWPRSLPGSLTG